MKISDNYPSLVQGVSQQTQEDRRDGQFSELVNMIPDPVVGLARRHGTKFYAESTFAATDFTAMVTDTATWRSYSYTNAGRDFVILYRTDARPANSYQRAMMVYDVTNKQFLTVVRNASDPYLDMLESGGVSALTSIGKFVFAAGKTITPGADTANVWDDAFNRLRTAVWVRGGAYSRTFKVSAVKTDNSTVSFQYTTPKSSYSGTLDTSGVPQFTADPAGGTENHNEAAYPTADGANFSYKLLWGAWTPTALSVKDGPTALTNVAPAMPSTAAQYSYTAGADKVYFHSSAVGQVDITITYTSVKTITNPAFAQIVSAMTNAYNGAVTTHIGTAAEAIQPQAIAEQLRIAAVAAGFTTCVRVDSSVVFDNVRSVTVQDGGDGTLIRGVASEITLADEVSAVHYVGKVVKVRAKGSEEAYYLKAVAKNGTDTGWAPVTWVEGPGVRYSILSGLIYGMASGTSFYMASSSALLNAILPGANAPTFADSTVGDADTSPLPFFINNKITYMDVFQDRLLIGAGGVIRASRVGDYLNFFRKSVLTAPADDTVEFLSQGSEDDTLKFSVMYDKNLVVFGDKRQYVVSGTTGLTPTSANMPVMSTHEGAGAIPPIAAGGGIFYGKQDDLACSVHEIRPGTLADSPESFPVSSQLSDYLRGQAIEMVNAAKPATLFLRTTGNRQGVYTFRYLDTTNGRAQDAWGRWVFPSACGYVVGMASSKSGMLIFSIREAYGSKWVVADFAPLVSGLATYPYMDSIRPWETVSAGTGSIRPGVTAGLSVAFDTTTEWQFLGAAIGNRDALVAEFPSASGLWAGADSDAYFIPSAPRVKNGQGTTLTSGRTTVTKLEVFFDKSSGFNSSLTYSQVTTVLTNNITSVVNELTGTVTPSPLLTSFNGYIFGDPNAIIGRVPITKGVTSIPIGREAREYSVAISTRKWLPLTISRIQWVGQRFNRVRNP